MDHQCYFPMNHKFQKRKQLFNGTIKRHGPPKPSLIDGILHKVKDLEDVILTKVPHMKPKISH